MKSLNNFIIVPVLVIIAALVLTKLCPITKRPLIENPQPNTNLITIHTPVSTVYIYAIDIEGHGKYIIATGVYGTAITKESL